MMRSGQIESPARFAHIESFGGGGDGYLRLNCNFVAAGYCGFMATIRPLPPAFPLPRRPRPPNGGTYHVRCGCRDPTPYYAFSDSCFGSLKAYKFVFDDNATTTQVTVSPLNWPTATRSLINKQNIKNNNNFNSHKLVNAVLGRDYS